MRWLRRLFGKRENRVTNSVRDVPKLAQEMRRHNSATATRYRNESWGAAPQQPVFNQEYPSVTTASETHHHETHDSGFSGGDGGGGFSGGGASDSWGDSGKGRKHSEESRAKMRAAWKRRKTRLEGVVP